MRQLPIGEPSQLLQSVMNALRTEGSASGCPYLGHIAYSQTVLLRIKNEFCSQPHQAHTNNLFE